MASSLRLSRIESVIKTIPIGIAQGHKLAFQKESNRSDCLPESQLPNIKKDTPVTSVTGANVEMTFGIPPSLYD